MPVSELISGDGAQPYCTECAKSLIDFRGKSDVETRSIIVNHPDEVCGIFNRNQIDFKTTHLSISYKTAAVGLSVLGILGFMGFSVTSCSPDSTQQHAAKEKAFRNLKFPLRITGTVADESTGLPLSGAGISICQNGLEILKGVTNEKGMFELIVHRKDLQTETFELIYQAAGHLSDTLKRQSLKYYGSGHTFVLSLKAESGQKVGKAHYFQTVCDNGEVVGALEPEVGLPPEEHVTAGVPYVEVMVEPEIKKVENQPLDSVALEKRPHWFKRLHRK